MAPIPFHAEWLLSIDLEVAKVYSGPDLKK